MDTREASDKQTTRQPLPELFCPFPSATLHVQAEELVERALEWTAAHHLLPDTSERTIEKIRSYSLLAASCYPTAPFDRLAAIGDYYSWLFFFDDMCENMSLGGASPREVRVALRGVYRVFAGDVDGGTKVPHFADALGDIWQRIGPVCTPAWRRRLAEHIESYIDGCVWEAQNRQLEQVPSRAVFQVMRMFTSTMYEFWDFIEYAGGFFLPDEVVDHPVLVELRRSSNAVASYANDIFSLRKEVENRDFHNLVLVLQHNEQLGLKAAYARAAALHDEQVRHYCALELSVPSFGPEMDGHVARYLEGMRIWMRANYDWSTRTPRYNEGRGVPTGREEARLMA